MTASNICFTLFTKSNGPLTKQISLDENGNLVNDSSACLMPRGMARRAAINGMSDLATLIGSLSPMQAIGLGSLRADLPDQVQIATKARMNGSIRPDIIARTASNIVFEPGRPALALIDFDTKGMPSTVAAGIESRGGFAAALSAVLPELPRTLRLLRASTSAGLYRADTGKTFPGSGGIHLYLAVADGADIERFLKTLHDRCWLAGLGWMMVGAGGQLLERSVVDRVVAGPERLVFEGPPVLVSPLAQNEASRAPQVFTGAVLDTVIACPPLTILEQATLRELRAKEMHRIAPDAARTRKAFVQLHADVLAKRAGIPKDEAVRTIERQCAGVLLPHVVLPFDDEELAGSTVADVLADPDRFDGATLADPLEGIEYGACKAKVMRRADGTPWIHSFAHGRTIYSLRFDFRAAERILGRTPPEQLAAAFVAVILAGDLTAAEIETLRDHVHRVAGIGKRPLDAMLKAAKAEHEAGRRKEESINRDATRNDPRPQVPAPPTDGEFLPVMHLLNDVLGSCRSVVPPFRDTNQTVAEDRGISLPSMSRLQREGIAQPANGTRLPAPEQHLIARLTDEGLAELIERHVEFVDETDRAVHLPPIFVKHYMSRDDNALPIATTVATLPIVLPNGSMLAGPGLHRPSGVIFRVPPELERVLPTIDDCAPGDVGEAMRFLTEDWLCDVAADYAGKCTIIAAALTVIERALLPERPAFFVTAGQRGGGKTTTVHMLSMAVLGIPACAAAWARDEDERRKALLSYFSAGVPMLTWDNIPRGASISCPHVERACTGEFYSDRVLGATEHRIVLCSAVHIFTGNNIGPRGDMASRSLTVRLAVDRADPENREFKHSDPIAWTEQNRGGSSPRSTRY